MLAKLIEKPDSELDIEEVEDNEIYKTITEMKSTNACGYDGLNSRIVKMIPHIMSLWMTHGMNSMIRTGIFQKVLKIARLTPIKKQTKNPVLTSSYRPKSYL